MFDANVLHLNAEAETQRLCSALSQTIKSKLHRRGAVVGVSGGVDSSVVLALCVRALGPDRVRALILPERESEPASADLARGLATGLGVAAELEDITAALEGFRCYERRDVAIRRVIPEYDPSLGYRAKITLPDIRDENTLNAFSVTVVRPDGSMVSKPLAGEDMREIMSASNLKQRMRMAVLYLHAEKHNYAVVGTPNKNEHDLGFFVKYGDGGTDVNPIVHLYKTQVYQLAEYLSIPLEIRGRAPTSDTYGAPSSQQEFFFRLPFDVMDLIWYGLDGGVPVDEIARAVSLSPRQVEYVRADLDSKRRATEHLRTPPVVFRAESAAAAAAPALWR